MYEYNAIIPQKEVEVGLNILSKGESTWVYPGVYNGNMVEVHRQWIEKSIAKNDYLSDITCIK